MRSQNIEINPIFGGNPQNQNVKTEYGYADNNRIPPDATGKQSPDICVPEQSKHRPDRN